MKHKVRVLLVDDHALVRSGFRRMLEDETDINVVGEASRGDEAVELATSLRPDVIVMDYALPGMNGALATRRILDEVPEAAVLILSMHAEESYIQNAFAAGARGYILKSAMDMELVNAIRAVAAGGRFVDPRLPQSAAAERKKGGLTTRELEVLQLIVEGKSNKEIATHLGLSVNTVSVHRANIMQELGFHNTAELVAYAIRKGLVSNQ